MVGSRTIAMVTILAALSGDLIGPVSAGFAQVRDAKPNLDGQEFVPPPRDIGDSHLASEDTKRQISSYLTEPPRDYRRLFRLSHAARFCSPSIA